MENFINLLDTPWSRRNSYIALANDNKGFDIPGKSNLWICNCRMVNYAMSDMQSDNHFRRIQLQAVKGDQPLPAVLRTTPEEVFLKTSWGGFRCCIAEQKLLLVRGDDGLSLRITPPPSFLSPLSVPAGTDLGRRVVDFGPTSMLITVLKGTLRMTPMFFEVAPDADGKVLVAFDDAPGDPVPRPLDDYPCYDAAAAAVRKEFDEFCAAVMPSLPAEFEPMRLQALWTTWSLMVDPDDENCYRRTMVKMIRSIFEQAFGWQMPMQAICLSRNPKLSWDVFCSIFEYQDANGRLADALSFKFTGPRPAMKPPIQGWALLWLMDHGVVDAAAPAEEERLWLLERLIKWTEYYFRFRDHDADGLCEYNKALETGWEDAPQYRVGVPQASPDLNAVLALSMEAIARFGATCGMPEAEQKAWMDRSRALIDKIVEKCWDGEGWYSFCIETGRRSMNDNIAFYMALLLGERLPKDVIEKSIARLFRAGGFDSPYGLTSEPMDATTFRGGFASGSVITPAEFLTCLGLEACGRKDLAQRVAKKYCAALKKSGFFHILNGVTGEGDRALTAYGERGLFWSAWCSSCYFFLADQYC